jgi:MFS family permease
MNFKEVFQNKYNRNILLYSFVTFFTWLSFWIPIYVFFYQSIGLSYTQISLLASIRSLVSLIFVIPTGVLADFFGRKNCIMAGTVFQILGFALLFVSHSFALALVANIMIGVFFAFVSGADIALIYDSLLASGQEKKFKLVQSLFSAVVVLSLAAASVVGGYVATKYSFRATILLNVIAYFIAFICEIFLIEPPKHFIPASASLRHHLKESILAFIQNKSLLFISIYLAIFTVVMDFSQSLIQPYFKMAGLGAHLFGPVNAFFLILSGGITFLIIYFAKNAKHLQIHLVIGALLVIFQFIVLSWLLNVYIAVFVVGLGQVAKGVTSVFIKEFSNNHIASKSRATMFSIQGFVVNFASVILVPFLGKLVDHNGVQSGYFYMAILIFCAGLLTVNLAFYHFKKPEN